MTLIHPFTSVEESRTSNVNKLLDGESVTESDTDEEEKKTSGNKLRSFEPTSTSLCLFCGIILSS